MKTHRSVRLWALIILLVSLVWMAVPAQAQTKSLYWRRWDVTIDQIDTTANRFDVAEVHDIQFTSGQFTFGYRAIPTNNQLERLDNIQVWEGETPLTQDCSRRAGTFCLVQQDGELQITYYFLRPAANEERVFKIEYTVIGSLLIYPDGDQLDWIAIAPDHAFPIQESTVTVRMPSGYEPRAGTDPVVSYGAPTNVDVSGDLITFTATGTINANQQLRVRVQYPHDPNARVASWQAAADREATIRPLINLLAGGLGLVLALLGPFGAYYLWYKRGRDPEIGVVPDYLSEPPGDLPPAIVGTLVDERADMQDVMSTLLDLAKRGYLIIEEDRSSGFLGIGGSNTFTFKRTDQPLTGLRHYEKRLISSMFKRADEVELDALRNKFYTAIPKIQSELYDEVVGEGFFSANPQDVRNRWTGIGMVLLFLALGIGGFTFVGAETYAGLICIPVGLGVIAISLLIVAPRMPVKTAAGAEATAKWKAFREYLTNLRQYTDVEQATDLFNQYLPYAVAFGLERAWINQFSRVAATPIPYWYYPVYMGGPWRRGYHRGDTVIDMRQPDIRSQLARPGGLEGMNANLSSGLNSMSAGLVGMLNNASTTFTSRPSSSGSSGSWSGGGGSFSGGGFSGGGGGGSAGFG